MAVSPTIEPRVCPVWQPSTAIRPHPGLRARTGVIRWDWVGFGAIVLFFGLLGAIAVEVDRVEARLGLAAGEALGPLGRVFGYWAPDVWPVPLFASKFLAMFENLARPTTASVRWPGVFASLAIAWLLWRGASKRLGARLSMWVAVCWLGSIGVVDHAAFARLDLLQTLGVVAAIDRLLDRGRDFVFGCWGAFAFLCGGLPPLVLLALASIVIGRPNQPALWRALVPIGITAFAWSAWTIQSGGVELWAAALTLPLSSKLDWKLAVSVMVIGLPWSPLVFFAWDKAVHDERKAEGHAWARTWVQCGIAAILAGTLVPGLSTPARGLALVGLAIAAALVLEAMWTRRITGVSQVAILTVLALLTFVWLVGIDFGCYIWTMSMPYYRAFGVMMGFVAIAVSLVLWGMLAGANLRRAAVLLVLLAAATKLVHTGFYGPEWNYRQSQGPWSRAVAQWIPRRSTVYTLHDWPADFAFYLKRPIRQLHSAQFLKYEPQNVSKFLLLSQSEFDNWSDSAIPITPMARFLDEAGATRVLARTTDGPMPLLGGSAGSQTVWNPEPAAGDLAERD